MQFTLLLSPTLSLTLASSLWHLLLFVQLLSQCGQQSQDKQYHFHGRPVFGFKSLSCPWFVEFLLPNWLSCESVSVMPLISCYITCICCNNCTIIGLSVVWFAPNIIFVLVFGLKIAQESGRKNNHNLSTVLEEETLDSDLHFLDSKKYWALALSHGFHDEPLPWDCSKIVLDDVLFLALYRVRNFRPKDQRQLVDQGTDVV